MHCLVKHAAQVWNINYRDLLFCILVLTRTNWYVYIYIHIHIHAIFHKGHMATWLPAITKLHWSLCHAHHNHVHNNQTWFDEVANVTCSWIWHPVLTQHFSCWCESLNTFHEMSVHTSWIWFAIIWLWFITNFVSPCGSDLGHICLEFITILTAAALAPACYI